MERKLVFAGLGIQFDNTHKALISILNRSPNYYLDSNPNMSGKNIDGIRVIPFDLLPREHEYDIYIFSRSFDEIFEQVRFRNIKANCYYVSVAKGQSAIIGTPMILGHKKFNDDCRYQINQFDLCNKTALITGASRGVGRVIAKSLAKLGCDLILQARDLNSLSEVVQECKEYGVSATPYFLDLRNLESLKQWLKNFDKESIDILYNNAGVSPENKMLSQFDVCEEDFYQSYTVNSIAPTIISSYFIGGMLNKNYGRIINLTTNIQNNFWSIAYACSKSALDKITGELALAVKGSNVSVSTVDPGAVRTSMSRGAGSFEVDSVAPGVLLGIFAKSVSGKNLIAQDYSRLSLEEALNKYDFIYGLNDD